MHLYQKGIRHSAVINIYGKKVAEDFTVALDVLKTAHKTYLEFKSTKQSYVVLGVAIDDRLKHRLVYQMNHFVPSLLIAVAHQSYDDRTRKDCRILPPTRLSTSIPAYIPRSAIRYGRSLDDCCDLLSEVTRAGMQVPMAISFSLSGRLYKPRLSNRSSTNARHFELFLRCQNFNGTYYVSPGLVCKSGTPWMNNVRGKSTSDTLFTFNPVTKGTLTFDDILALRVKACETKRLCKEKPFRLAVYDIEYDAFNTKCGTSIQFPPFGRLAFLRKMSRYIGSQGVAKPFDKTACLNVT